MEEKDYQEIKDKLELEQLRTEKKEKEKEKADYIEILVGAWIILPIFVYFALPLILWKTSIAQLTMIANKTDGWEALLQKLGILKETAQQWAQTNLNTMLIIGIITGIILLFITTFAIQGIRKYTNKNPNYKYF